MTFHVLSDVGNKAARSFGLVYTLPEELRAALRSNNKALPGINGDESWGLPVPATYVIARDGRIALAYIEVDYRKSSRAGGDPSGPAVAPAVLTNGCEPDRADCNVRGRQRRRPRQTAGCRVPMGNARPVDLLRLVRDYAFQRRPRAFRSGTSWRCGLASALSPACAHDPASPGACLSAAVCGARGHFSACCGEHPLSWLSLLACD